MSKTDRTRSNVPSILVVAQITAVALISAFAATTLAATHAEWSAAPEGTLKVEELTLARKVEGRRATETGESFVADGQRVYAFLRVLNKSKDRQLKVVWSRKGKIYHQARLTVKRSRGWRTWAYIKAHKRLAGSWTVTVENEDGQTLAQKAFVISR
jgi:hypothetical protein